MCAYYIPPLNTNNKFNSSSFNFQDKYINFHQGDSRYLLKNQYTGTGATGASGLGCQIVNTQLFDNVVAVNSSTFSGSGIPTNWTKTYTSIGGNLLIFCNFSCYAGSAAQYNFTLYIDGVSVDTVSFVFNTASFNETVPSIFHVNNPLSIGSHTIAISIPAGITVNTQNYLNMTIQESISATVFASTGSTGPIGPTGPSSSSYSGTGGSSQWGNNGSNIYFNSGNVAIGKTTPSYTLDVSGNINCVNYYANSDYRIKTNVEDLDYNIDKLKPKKYFNTLTQKKDCGFIADQLQQEFDFMVNGIKDGDNLQSVNYISLIPIIIKEIQVIKQKLKMMN